MRSSSPPLGQEIVHERRRSSLTWNSVGDEFRYLQTISQFDPSYDPSELEPYMADEIQPIRNREQSKKVIDEKLAMYLEIGGPEQFSSAMSALLSPMYRFYIPRKLLNLGLQEKTHLIEEFFNKTENLIPLDHLERGLEDAFQSVSEWELDRPGSYKLLCDFIAHLEERDFVSSTFLPSQIAYQKNHLTVKAQVISQLEEYFTSLEVQDFIDFVLELNCPPAHPYVIKYVFTETIEQSDLKREAGAKLLVALCASHDKGPVTTLQFMRGAELTIIESADLLVDNPKGAKPLAQLLARAVVDECLPPSFLENVFSVRTDDTGSEVLNKAAEMLREHSASSMLHKIWVKPTEDDE